MASLIAPRADADDTEAISHPPAHPATTLIPPERWLHAETVDELRKRRARIGLPVPRGLASVQHPPMTSLKPLLFAVVAPEQQHELRAGPGAGIVLGPLAGTVVGLLAGIICALVAYAAHLPIP